VRAAGRRGCRAAWALGPLLPRYGVAEADGVTEAVGVAEGVAVADPDALGWADALGVAVGIAGAGENVA
jgi:hypothetical protein